MYKLPILILRSSVRRNGGKIADSVLLRRNSKRDPDPYRANSTIFDNDKNTNSFGTIDDDSCKRGDASFSQQFRCKSKRSHF